MSNPIEPAADWERIKVWRRAQRAELLSRREHVPETERQAWNARISEHLLNGFEVAASSIVALCWPYRAEYDARFVAHRWRERGAITALPEVVANRSPLRFRKWWPGAPMRRGVYDIPVPDGTDILTPHMAIVPMNAFDGDGFRLGYGGGFFDRTLQVSTPRPITIGVSYQNLRVDTIYPQAHDIPMDYVVTELGIHAAGGAPLDLLDAIECRRHFARVITNRGFPRVDVYSSGYSSPTCYAAAFPEYFGGDEKST